MCGYLGSQLALVLAGRGHKVFGIDNLMYEQDEKHFRQRFAARTSNINFSIVDTRSLHLIRDKVLEFEPDVLVHFGDLSSVYACNHNPLMTRAISFEATSKIIDFCVSENIRCIYNSTSSLYGTQKTNRLMSESDQLPQQRDLYCETKISVENLIKAKAKKARNFKYIVFRPATVFGLSPRFRIELLPNHFCYSAVSKQLIKVSDLNAYRAFISVNQLCDVYTYCIESSIFPNDVYNVGSYNLTKLEVALSIQKLCDTKIVTTTDIGDLRNLQISTEKFEKEIFKLPKVNFQSEIEEVVKDLQSNFQIYESSNFASMLNMPLSDWRNLN